MFKKFLIPFTLLVSLLIVTTGCQKNDASIRIVGINVEKYDSKNKTYETHQKITKKADIETIKHITEKTEQNENDETTTETDPDFQFNYLFKTNNTEIKTVTYQIKMSGENELLLGIEGIYHKLSSEDSSSLNRIIVAK
ncbi:MAG: hypothetical protein RR554_09645 [Vagococcus sp.]|uniref:hypothetical protein n=1 Tax=Vagococcus sp. TaxID=1933889 RepID=UPI002FCC4F48